MEYGKYYNQPPSTEGKENRMKYRWCDINYEGIDFKVQGYWIDYQRVTLEQPEEGGRFDDWDILIGDVSVWELLGEQTQTRIIEQAEEILREMV